MSVREPNENADTVRWNGCTCTVFNGTHSPFPRLRWDEDCPRHGKAVNPYWPDPSEERTDGD